MTDQCSVNPDDVALTLSAQKFPAGVKEEPSVHLLRQLLLPSRYESLRAVVGDEIASLLVAPSEETLDIFRQAALHIRSRRRGLFLPVYADSGTGKTTLVSNLANWLAEEYGPTTRLAGGEVSADRLRQAVAATVQEQGLPLNDNRILIINIDDRESDPPSDKELSQIKSFVRESGEEAAGVGARTLVVWPETSQEIAYDMAQAYVKRSGKSPVDIPARVEGPSRETWPGLAVATLKLVNSIERLDSIGVDPHKYDPAASSTIGEFLDEISSDFVELLDRLLKSTRKPLRLMVVFVSKSGKAGVLSELTSGYRYGLVDGDKLLAATPDSTIGKWWKQRRGLLVQTIVRLDARVAFVPPALSIPVVNRFGPQPLQETLKDLGLSQKAPSEIANYFERSDFGRLLRGTAASAAEGRGNPATDAVAAFALMAEAYGFTSGRDKRLNQAFGDFFESMKEPLGKVAVETRAEGIPLIPDVSLGTNEYVTCIEFHWRSSEYLTSAHRSEIAQYVLKKLKSYVIELGWTSDR